MALCIKCLAGVEHPFHDDGTPNEADMVKWEAGGKYSGPRHVEQDDEPRPCDKSVQADVDR